MNKQTWLLLNAAFLFLTASMYLGTGWSEILFNFPVASQLTPANYYLVFVPPVEAATRFFTRMTQLMIVSALLMLWGEWKGGMRWAPILLLVGVLAATGLTVWFIFPHNAALEKGITDAAQLRETLDKWIALNRVRVWLWTLEWAAMMAYFFQRARQASQPAGNSLKAHA